MFLEVLPFDQASILHFILRSEVISLHIKFHLRAKKLRARGQGGAARGIICVATQIIFKYWFMWSVCEIALLWVLSSCAHPPVKIARDPADQIGIKMFGKGQSNQQSDNYFCHIAWEEQKHVLQWKGATLTNLPSSPNSRFCVFSFFFKAPHNSQRRLLQKILGSDFRRQVNQHVADCEWKPFSMSLRSSFDPHWVGYC